MNNTARILCYALAAAAASSLTAINSTATLDARGWFVVVLSGIGSAAVAVVAYADKGPAK